MTFGIFSYLITILIFAGLAVLIEWTLGFRKLKKYTKIIGVIAVIGVSSTLIAESVALSWRTWFYSRGMTFGIYIFGAALETLIYAIFVAVAISSATLAWSDFEEDKKPLIKTTFEEIKAKFKEWFL